MAHAATCSRDHTSRNERPFAASRTLISKQPIDGGDNGVRCCERLAFVESFLKCRHEITAVEISVAVPIAFFRRRVVLQVVLLLAWLKDLDQIRRVESTVAVGISDRKWHVEPNLVVVVDIAEYGIQIAVVVQVARE